jgi:hypothetical protein
MNLYKYLLIACSCVAFHSQVYSQSHDKDGYYIDLKGDTVRGIFMNYHEPATSPSVLAFQAAHSSALINLTPDQCKRAAIDQSDHFISYQGKRLTNSTDYHDVQPDSGDVFENISAFLTEIYNNGHYHLYQYIGAKRSNFYVSEGDVLLQELSYKEFINNGNVVEWPGFRLQLEDFFRPILIKDPGRQNLIDNLTYTRSSLTDLFNKMGGEKNSSAVKGKYPAKVFIGFGASSNSLKVTQASGFAGLFTTMDDVASYPSQTTPLFEAGVKFFSQRNYGRLFVMIKADYYQFKHSAFFDDGGGYHTTTTFKASAFALPIGIGYRLINNPGFSFDLSVGPAPLYLANSSETKDQPGVVPALVVKDNGKDLNVGFFGEAAFVFFNKLSVFGGYYSPVSISNSQQYDVSHTSLRFGARYYIF